MVHNLSKNSRTSCDAESSEDEEGVEVVIAKEGIPLPRSIRNRMSSHHSDGHTCKKDISPAQVGSLAG